MQLRYEKMMFSANVSITHSHKHCTGQNITDISPVEREGESSMLLNLR